jgi:hypothetical protein
MAKGKGRGRRGLQPEGLSDFAGGDADKETIEKLAEAAKKQNAKGGDNSEPKDEVIDRNFDAIELALIEIDNASRIMQKARAGLKAALDTAKTDCGSKAWALSIQASVKLKRQGEKGGNGELVTEHRQIGRILRLKGVPLGVQFKLFAFEGEPADGAPVAAMDAELQGQQAYTEGAKLTDNPFHHADDAERYNDWHHGWTQAQNAKAREMGGSGTEAATH